MAIHLGVSIAGDRSPDRTTVLYSEAFDEEWRHERGEVPVHNGWSGYVFGVLEELRKQLGMGDAPLRMVISSDLPIGAGISSSAALTMAVATLCEAIEGKSISPITKARACRQAEIRVGVPCGEMDFLASAMGVRDHVLRIDFQEPPTVRPLPMFRLDRVRPVLINTHVHRRLADGRYGQLRRAAESAKKKLGPRFARENTDIPKTLTDGERRCVEHVRSEMKRTDAAEAALLADDPATFGRLMKESHESLSNGLRVSCVELNFVADLLNACPWVFGARMMGGGFGGGVIALVEPDQLHRVEHTVNDAYSKAFGAACTIIPVAASDGAWGRTLSSSVDSAV